MTTETVRYHVPSELPRVEPIRLTSHWFDPHDAKGSKGHTHLYSYRTLACDTPLAPTCMVKAVAYQYVNIPGEPLPPRPAGRAIMPIYRQDLEDNWMTFQIPLALHRYYVYGMWSEYPETLYVPEDEPVDTGGVWLGALGA